MTTATSAHRPQDSDTHADTEIIALYQQLLTAWNQRDASAFAVNFAPESTTTDSGSNGFVTG